MHLSRNERQISQVVSSQIVAHKGMSCATEQLRLLRVAELRYFPEA